MTPNEKDYMDRYIYQVIHRLPKAQREEVRIQVKTEHIPLPLTKATTILL